jgi:hypothetical protein
MTGRDDLEELHALAASISEDAHGWRAQRRQRARTAVLARVEADAVAPIKRRKRHRWVAAAAVGVVAITAAVLVISHRPGPPAARPHRTILTERHLPGDVRVGHQAALQLSSQGRGINVFACEGLYDSERMAEVAGQQSATWRAGYLAACSHAGTPDAKGG